MEAPGPCGAAEALPAPAAAGDGGVTPELVAQWREFKDKLRERKQAGVHVSDAELGHVEAYAVKVATELAGPPSWWMPNVQTAIQNAVGPAVQNAVGPAVQNAVGPAVQNAMTPITNLVKRINNRGALRDPHGVFEVPANAAGVIPQDGLFPATTAELVLMRAGRHGRTARYARITALLAFYGIANPATGAPFHPGDPLPADPVAADAQLAREVDLFTQRLSTL